MSEAVIMGEANAIDSGRLTIRSGQMVFDVPSVEEGIDEIVYTTGIQSDEPTTVINLGGAWLRLVDGDAMLEALDRLGSEAPL
jgi:hypothetical protein